MNHTSLKNNFIYNLIYQLFVVITPIITTPYVSRVLSADGIGEYSYTLSNATYFTIFGCLGLATYGQLEIAKNKDDLNKVAKIIKGIFLSRFLTMLVSMIFYIGLIVLSREHKLMYLTLLLFILSQFNDLSFAYQGLELFQPLALRNFCVKLIGIILIFLCIKSRSDKYLYSVIIQGTNFLGNFLFWPSIIKYINNAGKTKITFDSVIGNIGQSVKYFIPTVATMVYTVLDKSMIGWITNSNIQNGVYEQAHKIEQILVAVVVSIGTITLPRIAYYHQNKKIEEIDHLVVNSIRFILFASIPIAIGISACADTLIPLFLGKGYEESVSLLRIFSILVIVVGLNNTIGKQCLIALGKQKQYNIGVILGAVFNIILNLLLIPKFLAKGAALASVGAECAILIVFLFYSKNNNIFSELQKYGFRYGIISILMGIIVNNINISISNSIYLLMLQIMCGIFIYFSCLLIIRDEFLLSIINVIKQKFPLN